MSKTPHVDPNKSGHEVWEEFSLSFTPAVKEVVEFAKRIPGFRDLSQHDQVNLLKAGTFEVRPLCVYCRLGKLYVSLTPENKINRTGLVSTSLCTDASSELSLSWGVQCCLVRYW